MKVAFVYDRVNKWGGAERVLLALHRLFPDAPLFTSIYNKNRAPWADEFHITPSFLQKIIPRQQGHELFAFAMPIAFESFSFDEYDVVISVTSEAAKGIITKPSTLHICLCLTPTRYLWSGYNEYIKNKLLKIITTPLMKYLQKWDFIAGSRPDFYVAISENVSKRIKKYYKRDSVVIYPPVELATHIRRKRRKRKTDESGYFLLVSRISRFTPYKRIDLAIGAANKLKINLKIVGEGKDIEYFRKKAGPTVEFVGRLTDDELSRYYKGCIALIFPGEEDFGLVMVEAQSFGKPVIAYRGGGALEILKEGKTGEFFNKQTVSSLVDVLENFHNKRYNIRTCIENAQRFSFERFEHEFKMFLNEKLKDYIG